MDVGWKDRFEDRLGVGFKCHAAFDCRKGFVGALQASFIEAGDRQNGQRRRNLREGIDEARVKNRHFVHRAVEKLLDAEFRDLFALGEGWALGEGKVGDHVALGAGEELRAFSTNTHELCHSRIICHGLTENVCIQGAAESFVRGHENDKFLVAITFVKERVQGMLYSVAD